MLQNFSPFQVLREVETTKRNGILTAEIQGVTWQLYLQAGELQYIDCSIQPLEQLDYYLSRRGMNQVFYALKDMPNLFQGRLFENALTWLFATGRLEVAQGKQLLEDIMQDALETFLWLTNAKISWSDQCQIPGWLTTILGNIEVLELSDKVDLLQQRRKRWQNCATELWSPHQCPYIGDITSIAKPIKGGSLAPSMLKQLAQLMQNSYSLRQLSLLLKQDELHVAQLLSPYIQAEAILLRDPKHPLDLLPNIPRVKAPNLAPSEVLEQKAAAKHKIICIDDSPTVLNEIQRFLEGEEFQVTPVDDPIQASSVIFRIKPDLILLDITMPKINGYKLCGLLRSSAVLDQTPIIMVTGNKGFIDKARAKLVGATDYLTKPFSQEGLMDIVTRHLE